MSLPTPHHHRRRRPISALILMCSRSCVGASVWCGEWGFWARTKKKISEHTRRCWCSHTLSLSRSISFKWCHLCEDKIKKKKKQKRNGVVVCQCRTGSLLFWRRYWVRTVLCWFYAPITTSSYVQLARAIETFKIKKSKFQTRQPGPSFLSLSSSSSHNNSWASPNNKWQLDYSLARSLSLYTANMYRQT